LPLVSIFNSIKDILLIMIFPAKPESGGELRGCDDMVEAQGFV
jgi:hypothetical protein